HRCHDDGHERGGARGGGKRGAERQPAFPGMERSGRDSLAVAELLDRETAVRLLPQPTTPEGFQRRIGRTRHELTPEDERVGPPSRLSSRTRLVPASAYRHCDFKGTLRPRLDSDARLQAKKIRDSKTFDLRRPNLVAHRVSFELNDTESACVQQ